MNYLAHLRLSADSPSLLLGALLGDFVGADYRTTYSAETCRGIELHRHIDRFTDSHPVTARSRRRLGDEYRLLKGVIVDVFYDHFLARHWDDYSDEPLEHFCHRAYGTLLGTAAPIPDRLKGLLPRMARENWLLSYKDLVSIPLVMNGLSRRLSRENTLGRSPRELIRNYGRFHEDFREFFPDLMGFAEGWKNSSSRGSKT